MAKMTAARARQRGGGRRATRATLTDPASRLQGRLTTKGAVDAAPFVYIAWLPGSEPARPVPEGRGPAPGSDGVQGGLRQAEAAFQDLRPGHLQGPATTVTQ